MIFLQVTPTMIVTPTSPQEGDVDFTPFVQKHYDVKRREQTSNLVTITNLTIPPGKVVNGVTYITPELILESFDEKAALDFAASFLTKEETDLFTIERNKDHGLQNL